MYAQANSSAKTAAKRHSKQQTDVAVTQTAIAAAIVAAAHIQTDVATAAAFIQMAVVQTAAALIIVV